MSHHIILSFILLAVIITIAATTSLAQPQPTPPKWKLPLTIISREINGIESVTNVRKLYINGAASKASQNYTSTSGWYATLIRNDLPSGPALYYVYPMENRSTGLTFIKCYAFRLPSPYPIAVPGVPPTLQFSGTMPYVKTNASGASTERTANVWRLNVGQYTMSMQTDSQPPYQALSKANFEAMDQHEVVDLFSSGGTEPNDSVFDVPAECHLPPAGDSASYVDDATYATMRDEIERPLLLFRSSHSTKYAVFSDKAASLLGTRMSSNVAPEKIIQVVQKLTPPSRRYRPAPSFLAGLAGSSSSTIDNSIYASPVRDQNICGCCHAMAAVASTEIVMNMAAGRKNAGFGKEISRAFSLSVQSLIDCAHGDRNGTSLITDKGCFGGDPGTDMQSIVEIGISLESDYPYEGANGARCKLLNGWSKSLFKPLSDWKMIYSNDTTQNAADIASALAEHGAVVIIMSVPQPWIYMGDGIFDLPCKPGLNHAVTVVGMGTAEDGTPYWKIKNSFGRQWGNQGYFRILRGKNTCGVEQMGFVPIPA